MAKASLTARPSRVHSIPSDSGETFTPNLFPARTWPASAAEVPASAKRKKAKAPRCVARFEREARQRGFRSVAGVDEVGRGALFGAVVAAAVILDPEKPIRGLNDSKILDAENRVRLAAEIKRKCVAWAVGAADAFEVDQINILEASRLAMRRAVARLQPAPDYLLVDAVVVDWPVPQLPLIDGDARCRAIAAASIVAKVHRDALLDRWHEVFPQYDLASNKGYSTPGHRRALAEFGPTAFHRFSFEPVRLANFGIAWWSNYREPDSAQGRLFANTEDGGGQ